MRKGSLQSFKPPLTSYTLKLTALFLHTPTLHRQMSKREVSPFLLHPLKHLHPPKASAFANMTLTSLGLTGACSPQFLGLSGHRRSLPPFLNSFLSSFHGNATFWLFLSFVLLLWLPLLNHPEDSIPYCSLGSLTGSLFFAPAH